MSKPVPSPLDNARFFADEQPHFTSSVQFSAVNKGV